MADLEPGRYEIDGERVFVIIQQYETKNPQAAQFEAHNHYLDIQYMIQGEELFAVADRYALENLEAVPYDEKADIVFFRDPSEICWTKLKEGAMVVVGPEDAHKPCCRIGEASLPVKKAVVKIRLDNR